MPSPMFKHGKHHYYRRKKGSKKGGRHFSIRKGGRIYKKRYQRFSPALDLKRKRAVARRKKGTWRHAHVGDARLKRGLL